MDTTIAQRLFKQQQEIARLRQRLEQLKYAGPRELARQAEESLVNMCETLMGMRRQQRVAYINARESRFAARPTAD